MKKVTILISCLMFTNIVFAYDINLADEYKFISDHYDRLNYQSDINDLIQDFVFHLEERTSCEINVHDALEYLRVAVAAKGLGKGFETQFESLCYLVDMPEESNFGCMLELQIRWGKFQLCKKKKRAPKIQIEVPDGVAIGFCEALSGALLCITPIPGCRYVGVAMISDGVRRMLDSSEAAANANSSNVK